MLPWIAGVPPSLDWGGTSYYYGSTLPTSSVSTVVINHHQPAHTGVDPCSVGSCVTLFQVASCRHECADRCWSLAKMRDDLEDWYRTRLVIVGPV